MFDTYLMRPARTEFVTREVHEHRAPTDESVKLLREMEAAADANRIAALKLEGNAFTGHIEIYQLPEQAYLVQARAVFDVNGKRCTAKASAGRTQDHWHKVELMQNLHAEIAKLVASEILGEGMKDLRW